MVEHKFEVTILADATVSADDLRQYIEDHLDDFAFGELWDKENDCNLYGDITVEIVA